MSNKKDKKSIFKKMNESSSEVWNEAWKEGNLMNSIGAITGGISGIAQAGISNAQIADTSEDEAYINEVSDAQFGSGSYDNLLNSFDSNIMARTNYTADEVRGIDVAQMASNTLSGVVSGAGAGAQIGGPWGALAGGVVGLIGGIGGMVSGDREARKKAAVLNSQSIEANKNYLNSFSNSVENTKDTMFNNSLLNITAYGGPLHPLTGGFNNGITFINEGGTHEENPFGGVPVGVDREGIPNLVEEGEVIYNDYVFSNRLKPTKKQLKDNGFKDKYQNWTFAKIVEDLQKESSENPIDFIAQNTLEDNVSTLIAMQESIRNKKQNRQNKFDTGGGLTFDTKIYQPDAFKLDFKPTTFIPTKLSPPKLDTPSLLKPNPSFSVKEKINKNMSGFLSNPKKHLDNYLNPNPTNTKVSKKQTTTPKDESSENAFSIEKLRYASPLIQAGSLLNNLKEPDYSGADRIEQAARNIPGGSFTPLGDYVNLQPLDRNYYLNPLLATSRSSSRAIQNQGLNAGQTIAGLLANQYNTNTGIGTALMQMEQENMNREMQEAQFNRGTNQANAQMAMQALHMDQQRAGNILNATSQAVNLRNQLDAMRSQAISSSLTGIGNDLTGIGQEAIQSDWLQGLLKTGALRDYTKVAAKNGGMLTRNKRRRK